MSNLTLTSDNWALWKEEVKVLLMLFGAWQFIDASANKKENKNDKDKAALG